MATGSELRAVAVERLQSQEAQHIGRLGTEGVSVDCAGMRSKALALGARLAQRLERRAGEEARRRLSWQPVWTKALGTMRVVSWLK